MKNVIAIIIVCILSVGTILPLFETGFFEFHDNTQVVRVHEMGLMLLNKSFPVRFVPDLGYGYGYPIFNFYAPFPYYVGGLFTLIGFNALIATKLMFAIGILSSSISMFYLVRKFFGIYPGVAASIVYAYFPYHAVNIYVRGAVGEFFAYAFLPLVFLGLFRLIELKDKKLAWENIITVILTALGIFLTAISHNLSLLMLFILLVPYFVIALTISPNRKFFTIYFLASLTLGILLSSFYILPAFLEMGYTNVSSQVGGGANFRDHFICIPQLWESVWGYGGSVPGCVDGISFKISKINVALLIFALCLLSFLTFKKKPNKEVMMVFLSLFLLIFSLFMTTNYSELFWNSIPFMEFLQYPWRFLNFVGLFTAFVIGFLVFIVQNFNKSWAIGLVILISVITIVLNTKLFAPQFFTEYPVDYYTKKEYIQWTVSKISDEYLPKGFAKPRSPSEVPTQVYETKIPGNFKILRSAPAYIVIAYSTQKSGIMHINRAYYPSWQASVDGQSLAILPAKNGMDIPLSAGEGELHLTLSQTPLQILGNALSIIAISGIFIGIIYKSKIKTAA